jgi:hypothetical protein
MKRYIEIIFDDSYSMNSSINGEQKHLIAKRLFKEKILPTIGKSGDLIYLRKLSSSCGLNHSVREKLPNNLIGMSNIIDSINCLKDTPLFYTVKDSIESCKLEVADEKHIFILTDGDDTCRVNPEFILGADYLKIKKQLNLNTILIQFAINSSVTENNLTAFSQKIGATNLIINSNELKDFSLVGKKLNKAFQISGFDNKSSLIQSSIEGTTTESFDLLELVEGIDFYLVELLYKENLLSWKPNRKKEVTPIQKLELDFLYNLRFRNNLPEALVKQMLSTLQKPYQYSFSEIYWDFNKRVWKYFPEIPILNTLPNPDALLADKKEFELIRDNNIKLRENFNEGQNYIVELLAMNEKYKNKFKLDKFENDINKRPIYLKEGDIVKFID